MEVKDTLFIIPARGGSKGLPRKNILPLAGKPMIYYTIDAARGASADENICVTTDDIEIKALVEDYGLKVPFIRPPELASDNAGSREVLLHAVDFYRDNLKKNFSRICLLQPTSPLRTSKHVLEAFSLWGDNLDSVVSVKITKANPYFVLFEEDEQGYLAKSKTGDFVTRQDCPTVYQLNGAIYIYKLETYLKDDIKRTKRYLMPELNSVDIDSEIDFKLAELLMEREY